MYKNRKKIVKMHEHQNKKLGTKQLGTVCPEGLRVCGPNWLGTVCPLGSNFWGPFVKGDRIGWGPFVQGDQFNGDRLSRGTGSGGPEVRGSNGFGTKCAAAAIRLRRN